MSDGDPAPRQITPFPNGEIGIVWSDGHESYYKSVELRCACSCAQCVDEMSGRKVLDDSAVPKDIHALEIHPVGNYGYSVLWSDRHDTGIYTFKRLRELCDCAECSR
jgi:ATP-binding protein involved in chromosome partitioning